MDEDNRLKTYLAMAEVSRKWVAVMDTKAAFLSAMNAALLTFIWVGAKLITDDCWQSRVGGIACGLCLLSLLCSLKIIIPRGSLRKIFSKHSKYVSNFKPVSFYGFVASNYPKGSDGKFFADVNSMTVEDFSREALEQHFTICHVISQKEYWVSVSGRFLIIALVFTGLGLIIKTTS